MNSASQSNNVLHPIAKTTLTTVVYPHWCEEPENSIRSANIFAFFFFLFSPVATHAVPYFSFLHSFPQNHIIPLCSFIPRSPLCFPPPALFTLLLIRCINLHPFSFTIPARLVHSQEIIRPVFQDEEIT